MTHAFVYVTDKKGFSLTQKSAISVAMSQRKPCDIYIFCYKFPPDFNENFLSVFARLGHKIFFKDISDPGVENHETCGHVTTPALLKLKVVEEIIDDHEITVYLDNDILVFDDLKLEEIDFQGNAIAAVADLDLSNSGVLRDIDWSDLSNNPEGYLHYFNAGLIIFNREKWEASPFRTAYMNALDQHDIHCDYKLNCTAIDQCAFNSVFKGKWLHLPATYNMQASAKFTSAWQTATVRHYCGTRKFLPLSPLRNDARDVSYLNNIERSIGEQKLGSPFFYQVMFTANRVQNFANHTSIRRLLKAIYT